MMDEEQARLWVRGGLDAEFSDAAPAVDARTRMYARIRRRGQVRRWSVSVLVPLAVAAVIALVVFVAPALLQQRDSQVTPASTPTPTSTKGSVQVPSPATVNTPERITPSRPT